MRLGRARVGFAALLALAVAAGASPAWAAGRGSVSYVTSRWAFLDRGSADGLTAGSRVSLYRHGHHVASCHIRHLAAHHAACAVKGAHPGDSFRIHGRAPAPKVVRGKPPARVPRGAARLVARHRLSKVTFHGSLGTSVRLEAIRLHAAIRHDSWIALTGSPSYGREQIELSARGIPIAFGFSASVEATLLAWTGRPAQMRYRPDTTLDLFVWETAVERRAPGGLVVSVGRFSPWHAPGIYLLDGAQVGWAPGDGTTEIGVYAGALPNAVTLAPSTAECSMGAYATQRFHLGDAFQLHYDARVGLTRYAADPGRFEGELVAGTDIGSALSADVDIRMAFAGKITGPLIDALRAGITWRLGQSFQVRAGYRGLSSFAADPDGVLPAAAPASDHADGSIRWQPSENVDIGVSGDVARFQVNGTPVRADVGPELSLPHLFGRLGGVSLGVLEGFGWEGGPNAWVSALVSPTPALHLLLRGGFARVAYAGSPGDPYYQGSGLLGASYAFGQRISARLSLLVDGGSNATAMVFSAGVDGRF